MRANSADSEHGEYRSKEILYLGGFKNNAFHGQGKETLVSG
jgi:hypothetical protein